MIDQRQANKLAYKKYCDTFRINASGGLFIACKEFHSENAAIHVTAPINFVNGFAGLYEALYKPLLYAMPDLYRRTELLFSGNAKGGDWVTGHGHLVGTFKKDWMGIPATGQIVFIRFGEFHRMEDGRAVESYLFFDIIDLMRQIDRWPLPVPSVGEEFFIPGPITCDGIVMAPQDDD